LDNNGGCYANNSYFGKFFELSNTRVSLVISSLINKGYVISNVNQSEGNKRLLKTSLIKFKDPIQQKLKHNNTINNKDNKQKSELFETFWGLYEKPIGKKIAKQKFLSLSLDDCKKAINVAPTYIKATPDRKFRKHASTWLNQECFNDEYDSDTGGISSGKLKGMVL
jgi:hypothetical protein